MIALFAWIIAGYVAVLSLGDLYLILVHLRRSGAAIQNEQAALSSPPVPTVAGPPEAAPTVCVQLPLHNEAHSVAGTIDALCRLDWPADRLEIMILDDSTDSTTTITDERAAWWRARGLDGKVLRREERREFKAGALQDGLARTQAPYLAIFDADYRPSRPFLRQAMNVLLADQRIAFVQARLDYRNRDASWLTRAQGLEIDTLLAYEQAAKNWAGLPTIFNGTCGLWRRTAIEAAGGWSGRSVAEDQDLSYRCLEQGWTSRYLVTLAVPGELPNSLTALASQRRRWGTGTTQVLRRLPRRLLHHLSWHQAAAFMLLSLFNATSSLAVMALLLAIPVAGLLAPPSLPAVLSALATAVAVIVVGKTIGSALATRLLGRRLDAGYMADVVRLWVMQLCLLPIGSLSFLTGLLSRHTAFVRTPKTGA